MQSVGEQIRETRLRLGLTLEDVRSKTRIPTKNLEAIERDDLTQISSAFLYKSFVRQFAEAVQLPFEQLAPALEETTREMPTPRLPGEGDLLRGSAGRISQHRPRNFRWLYSVGSLAFMLVACTALYSAWQNPRSGWRTSLSKLADLPTSLGLKGTGWGGRADAAATKSGQVDPEYRVEVSALESTWLSIVEDGKQTFKGVLDIDQTKVLEGRQTARIRTGNAGGISCVFNGKHIGTLGPRGQVRTVVFTRSHYEVLETPTPLAFTLIRPYR